MKFNKIKIVQAINVPKILCDRVVGKNHPIHHRMVAGTVMMAIGVGISKVFVDVHFFFISEFFDGLGYLIHGVGTIPFAEWLAGVTRHTDTTDGTTTECDKQEELKE